MLQNSARRIDPFFLFYSAEAQGRRVTLCAPSKCDRPAVPYKAG
jgi:hypothetical protein